MLFKIQSASVVVIKLFRRTALFKEIAEEQTTLKVVFKKEI